MRIGMLGPLEVRADDGSTVEVAGVRLRTLLVALALEPGRVVTTARLIDGIWGAELPAGAANALQALVSRLRRAVPQAQVESHPAGYRLVIEADAVDVVRFEWLVAAARAAPPVEAERILREALDLWRGPALLDVAANDFFRARIARLEELRLAALEDRADAELRLGRGAGLTAELAPLVAEHPLRERLVGALMRALAVAGRSAEALAVYERTRAALVDELGVDPSPELSAVHTAVLRGELDTPAPSTAAAGGEVGTRTNLRAALTSFVGRDDDVAAVVTLVGAYRLTTLTGPGGSGKTRLAMEASRPLVEQFPDGVWLVELAPVTSAADLPPAVLSALGVRDQALPGLGPAPDPAGRLVAALHTRNALLVLDNCEHLVESAAALAERLLGECPRMRILATSREPLGITGEALWPVTPLALPPAGVDVAEAVSYPAVRLLADRAAAARPGFELTALTLPDVVRICHALDGMPLAIELAAARLRTMTPAQLFARLDDRFRLLTGGARTALPRQRTLRAVVDWSWELLSKDERRLLRRLAVFSGGATADAARRVCGLDAAPDLLDGLADKSLLVTAGDGRYRMLETIKAYGLARLDEAGERDQVRRAHAAYFAELAETADPHLRRAEQLVWLDTLAAEHDNINAALRGAVAAGDAASAVRLVAAAGWYWWLAGHKAEGAELTTAALAVPGDVDHERLALACGMWVLFATSGLGDERPARQMLHRAQRLASGARSRHPLLRFLEPMDQWIQGGYASDAKLEDTVGTLLEDEDPWVRAQSRLNYARLLSASSSRHAEAEEQARAGLAEFRAIGERWGTSFALTVLADLLAERGELAAALAHYAEAVDVAGEIGTVEDVLWMRGRQAQLYWLHGDEAGSAAALAAADREAARIAWPDAVAGLAGAKAELARWRGDLDTARAELARAEAAVRHLSVHPVFRARIASALGYLEVDPDAARARHAEALHLAVVSAHTPTVARALTGVADLALRQGNPAEAACLLSAGDAVRGTPDRSDPDAARIGRAARAALGEKAFAEAARSGAGATVATAEDLAAATLT